MSAWLLSGGSPSRRRSEALELARALLCPGHVEDPPCRDCRRLRDLSHPDFHAVPSDAGTAPIPVDRVREALRFASGRPYEAPARVVWIEQAERLQDAGANALLKSLEEPPFFLTWILGAESRDMLLPTVRSRCRIRRLGANPASGGRPERPADAEPPGRESVEDADRTRQVRERTLRALGTGETSSLLALAAEYADDDEWPSLLAALLRDAAILACGVEPRFLIHAGAASEIRRVSRVYSARALCAGAMDAAGLAADDRLHRNRRLSRERVLLGLKKAGSRIEEIGGRRSTRGEEGG
jgi:hypothetical protein